MPVAPETLTSEGCSSCPPADALLSDLVLRQAAISLAYHVDYWNHLGRSDPFSSHQWSERQSEYVQALNLDGAYTPQMVIGGRWQCAGSDGGEVLRTRWTLRVPTSPLGCISIHNEPCYCGVSKTSGQKSKRPIIERRGAEDALVMLAIYENGLVSKIGAGENGGREITYDYTVKELLPAFELDAAQPGSFVQEMTIDLDPSWST